MTSYVPSRAQSRNLAQLRDRVIDCQLHAIMDGAASVADRKMHYFIVTLAGAMAAGMFGGGGHGPDFTPTKAAFSEIGANLAKLSSTSSISAGVICLFIFFSSSRFDFGAIGNRRSDVHFASLFYMHLVSGDCRLAFVLYRLYLAWPKRCAGAAAKVLFGSPPRSQHHECEIEPSLPSCATTSCAPSALLRELEAEQHNYQPYQLENAGHLTQCQPPEKQRKWRHQRKKCRFEIEQRRGDTNDTKSSARDILTIPMRFKLAMSPDRR